jgi:hypothetical protein
MATRLSALSLLLFLLVTSVVFSDVALDAIETPGAHQNNYSK